MRRGLPHGVMHWRYLTRHPTEPYARQRSLWLAAGPMWPRPVWLVGEGWLWLRWQLWDGPRSVWRAVRQFGPSVGEREGLGSARQLWRVGVVSAGYCVLPVEIYRYRLYRRPNRGRVAEFVYFQSVAAFHASRNSLSDGAIASMQLLVDKERQLVELAALGIPAVATLAIARRGSADPLDSYLHDYQRAVFCKPRHGSGGLQAFTARRCDDTVVVDTLGGTRLEGDAAAVYWRRRVAGDDVLVQPRLTTHPALKALSTMDDVVTVRYITQRRGAGDPEVECYCATLEIPAGRSGAGLHPSYVIVPVDAASGTVTSPIASLLPLLSATEERNYRRISDRLGGLVVPGWDAICSGSQRAHSRFPGVYAIAWDWVVTPDGPLLLEGNGTWRVLVPQLLKGGLLRPTLSL